MRLAPLLIALPLLAACHGKSDADRSTTKTVVITEDGKATASVGGETGFRIDTDKFKASLDIPGMEMGGKSFNVDGMSLLADSKVRGMKVQAHEADGKKDGTVTISFVSPGAPAAVLDHAEAEAKAKGWTIARTDTGLGGTKGGKTLAYKVAAAGTGTTGTITLTGDEDS